MSYVAVTCQEDVSGHRTFGHRVIEVVDGHAASLDAMVAAVSLGRKNVRRIATDAAAFVAFSEGAELVTDIDDSGRVVIVKK